MMMVMNLIRPAFAALILFGMLLLVPSTALAMADVTMQEGEPEFQTSWQSCKTDAECILVEDPCEEPEGVNKRFKKDYLHWLSVARQHASCAALETDGCPVEAFCDQYFKRCSARNQPNKCHVVPDVDSHN